MYPEPIDERPAMKWKQNEALKIWMSNALKGLPTLANLSLTVERLTVRVMVNAGNAALDLLRFPLFRKTDNPLSCIVAFRAGAFGDFVVALPALRLLRKQYPKAKIILLTVTSLHPRWKNQDVATGAFVLARHLLDETLLIPGLYRRDWKGLRRIRNHILQMRPDACVMLPFVGEPFRSRAVKMVLLRLLGCRNNLCGYHARSTLGCFRKMQHKLGLFDHQVMAPVTALKELDITCDEVVFEIRVPDKDAETVDSWWAEHGLGDDSQLCIAISPFAKQKHKCWPVENYRQLGCALQSRLPGVRLIVVGGPEDEHLGDVLTKKWGGKSVNFAGKASILQSAEIIRRCKLFVGNDSGPSHLAAAVGIPVVTVFSSFVFPELWRPWGPKSRIIRHSVPCEFCFTENGKCPKGTNVCIDEISVDEVFARCLTALEGQTPAEGSSPAKHTLAASSV
jgi:ADP-heptose:LPS heptosyltransferase